MTERNKEAKRQRGVFEKVPGSGVCWIRYIDAKGKLRREVAGRRSAAISLYRKRKTEALEGKKLPSDLRSVTRVEDITPALLRDYRLNKRKSLDAADRRLKLHLLPHFGKMIAAEVAPSDIARYIDKRKTAHAENGTINRELAALKRVFNLARAGNEIQNVPKFPRLKENAAREGFIEGTQFRSLMSHANELWLKGVLAAAYTFGFRRSELLNLKVRNIDPLGRRIRLDGGSTKNGEGRFAVMTPEVAILVMECIRGKQPEDHVFTRAKNQPVLNFRGAWYGLCERAGQGRFVKGDDGKARWTGLLFHDLRRSAVRNMVRASIPELIAMKISGHKTRSVFDRYNIVSETDIEAATKKLERAQATDTTTSTAPDYGKNIVPETREQVAVFQ